MRVKTLQISEIRRRVLYNALQAEISAMLQVIDDDRQYPEAEYIAEHKEQLKAAKSMLEAIE